MCATSSHGYRSEYSFGFESLEPRMVLAAQYLISEFMASNTAGILDQDNQLHDWIEVQNVGDSAGNLQGYYLTDNRNDLLNWDFPSVPVAAGGFVRVFASGKDRAVAGQELHTDFGLEKNGGYLALVAPNGSTIVHKYDEYPDQLDNISYGVLSQASTDTLVTSGANVKWHVPASGVLGSSWTAQGFNDTSWVSTATVPASTVVVTEIGTASPRSPGEDWFEIQNASSNTVDTTGWVVAHGENTTNINAVKPQLWSIGSTMTAGQVRYRTDLATDTANFIGTNISWQNGAVGKGWVMIVDDEGSVVDFTAFGWTGGEIAAMNTTVNGFAITPAKIAAAWSGNSLTGAGLTTVSMQRVGNSDNNTSANWSWTTQQAVPGGQNAGISIPFPPVQLPARTGVGYERGVGYDQYINADTETAMFGANATAYMRIPFDVDVEEGQPIQFEQLELKMRYDDGFVAYINGTEVARRNAPGLPGTHPAFDADATASREGATETLVETIDLSSFVNLLVPSGNVLAIHGLNDVTNDTDFLILPELTGINAVLLTENFFTTPTPGAANVPGTLGFVADTNFSVDRGFFEAAFPLSIRTDTPGAQIRYTLDGMVPTATTGLVYSSPITISNTAMVRAAAFKSGYTPTNVDTQSYIKLSSVIQQNGANLPPFTNWGHAGPDWEMDPEVVNNPAYSSTIINDLKSIPTMSLVMPWTDWFGPSGIYIAGSGIERAASAELINADGSEGFQINSAVEIQGGSSDQRWKDDKLSIQVKFQSAYGPPELEYDLFGGDAVDRFDTFILDSVLNYSWLHWQDGNQRENAKYIQDQFVADLQQATGGAAPHGNYVHLYLNGLYWGMYYIHERPDENWAASYLGGNDEDFDILKHTSSTVVAGSSANYQAMLNLANQDLTFDTNYQALLGKLDIVPFIDYMIVNFYAGNTDWAHHNWYASFNRVIPGSKWHFHSWDAEHVLKLHEGNTNVTARNDAGSPTAIHQRLSLNTEYRLLFADRVHKHFFNGGVMTPAKTAAAYQARMAQIDRAIVGESARWGDNGRAAPYTRNTDWFPDNQQIITSYFPSRTSQVLTQFLSNLARPSNTPAPLYTSVTPPSFNQHGGTINPPFGLTMSGAGTIYYTTDGSDPRLPGGAVSPTALTYGGAVILNNSTRVKARVLSGGNWSALNEATFLLPAPPVRIAEINYAPVDPPAGSPYAAGDFEWVEVVNAGTGTVNLNGFEISGGINFIFGNQSLNAGQRIVVVKNLAAFQSRYGNTVNLANGVFTGSLNNAGEDLVLLGAFDETVQSFTYDNNDGWPGRADGKGSTLEIINALGDETNSNNWRNSTEYNGTPGAAGVGAIDSIVVNEILTHTDLPLVDAIELHNPTAAAIDIGGWYLSDTDNNLKKYRVAYGTVIPAGGYLVFDETQFGVGVNGFGLDGANGDDIYVTSATVAGVLQNFIDHVDFPAAVNGESFGRWPNATGKHYPMQSRTFGASNSGPRIGPVMISEIMYAPPGTNDDLEYIELLNLTDSPINLANWKFDEGVDFTFGNVTIQPRSTLVVVRFDPTNPANATKLNTFRNTYGITAAVPLVGGYGNPTGGGVLDNGGEELRLERPDAPQPDMSIPYLLVDEVDFDSVSPWPTSPDGTGHSLTRLSQFVYGHEPSNWVGQTPSPGSFPLLAAVTGLTATTNPAQANQIHVQWNDINGEDGYRLERSPDGANWTLIATLGPDATGTIDSRLQSSFTYYYRIRAFNATLEGPLSNSVQVTTPQLVTITGAAGHDTYHVQRVGTQIHVYENTAPVGQPTYSSELAALGASLTIDALAGDDTLTVTANGQPTLGVNQLLFNSGSGTNSLQLTHGAALIDSTVDAGSVLNTTVSGGAQLTTARLNQNGLSINGAGTRVTIQPDGALANVLGSLTMDATSTLDLTNNDLVLRATAGTTDAIHADAQAKITSAQNGLDANLVTNWDGPGITSASARASNVATGFDLISLGVIRNSDLDVTTGIPGSSYTSFGGVPVTADDVLLKYTYIGDANLNGVVSFDDYVGMDNAFFELIPNLGWATGDVTFDNAINFDDYSKVDQAFFFQGAPLATSSLEEASGFAGGSGAETEEASGSAGASTVGVAEESVGRRPTLQVVAVPAQIASSEVESHSIAGSNLQAADSLADARLSVTRRSETRDLWDDAIVSLFAE